MISTVLYDRKATKLDLECCLQVGCVGCIWFAIEGCWINPKLDQKELEGKSLLWFEEVEMSLDFMGYCRLWVPTAGWLAWVGFGGGWVMVVVDTLFFWKISERGGCTLGALAMWLICACVYRVRYVCESVFSYFHYKESTPTIGFILGVIGNLFI